jgi:hypothetical protein
MPALSAPDQGTGNFGDPLELTYDESLLMCGMHAQVQVVIQQVNVYAFSFAAFAFCNKGR